jgi:hypothetical protein
MVRQTNAVTASKVAEAMGLPTTKPKGPHISTRNGARYFSLGDVTPTQYRAKRATGWDPTKAFPMPDTEAM